MGWKGWLDPSRRGALLAQDLLDARDRLVDRPLGGYAVGGDRWMALVQRYHREAVLSDARAGRPRVKRTATAPLSRLIGLRR